MFLTSVFTRVNAICLGKTQTAPKEKPRRGIQQNLIYCRADTPGYLDFPLRTVEKIKEFTILPKNGEFYLECSYKIEPVSVKFDVNKALSIDLCQLSKDNLPSERQCCRCRPIVPFFLTHFQRNLLNNFGLAKCDRPLKQLLE